MDYTLLKIINVDLANPFCDVFMTFISDKNNFIIPLILVGLYLLIRGSFRDRVFIVMTILSLIVVDMVVIKTLKRSIGRLRPHESVEWVVYRHMSQFHVRIEKRELLPPGSRGKSMPSSHVGNMAALALLLTLFYPRWRHAAWLLPLLMAYSRVYVGSHFPSDTLVGFLIGVLSAYGIVKSCEYLWKKLPSPYLKEVRACHPNLLPVSTPAS